MSAQDNHFDSLQTMQHGNGAAQTGGADLIRDTTTAGFAADVIQESSHQPVLVDFWAPWCGPCKQLAPALEKAVTEAGGRVKLVKMNIDDHPSIAGQLGIQSIPAVIAFVNGQPVDGFMGAVPESKINEFIDKLAGPGDNGKAIADTIAAATELRTAGDLEGAAQLYASVLAANPAELDAIAGLAETLLDAGQEADAREVVASAPQDSSDAPQLAAIKARLALLEQAAALGDPAEFERRLAADPADHQARFDLALIQNTIGERDKAADNLLAIMKADREWQEDGARQQLLKFFEAWGMSDAATLSARRKLSSLLFS